MTKRAHSLITLSSNEGQKLTKYSGIKYERYLFLVKYERNLFHVKLQKY